MNAPVTPLPFRPPEKANSWAERNPLSRALHLIGRPIQGWLPMVTFQVRGSLTKVVYCVYSAR
jgi:hypothetical protein